MKYIQDENIYVLIVGSILFALLIWWTRKREIKENENSEMDSVSKMYKWRVYIIAGLGLLFFLNEILKRLTK